MLPPLSTRFWVEAILCACSAISFAGSLIWPQWIEAIFEVSPDQGDGSAEWGIALAFLVATIILSWLARTEWRRATDKAAAARSN